MFDFRYAHSICPAVIDYNPPPLQPKLIQNPRIQSRSFGTSHPILLSRPPHC
jgi:hypothetical protein